MSGPVNPLLRKLYDEVGRDEGIVARFVGDYLALLDRRIETILEELDSGDVEAAVVAVLSLETTSGMIGARGVVDAARQLREALEQHDGDDAHHQAQLHDLAQMLVEQAGDIRAVLQRAGYSAAGC
ncbi:MAG TPA: hypothetical protein VFP89_08700 [Propionibacteriaceae bacterium]|nr:hypothetical protein [Propionibacteriaceae bacterium]